MPTQPPGAPSRPRATGRLNQLARGHGASAAATTLRSRASLESDTMLSNSDESASFLHMPTRQPVFTHASSSTTTTNGLIPTAHSRLRQHSAQSPSLPNRHEQRHQQPISLIELQQQQSGGSGNRSPSQSTQNDSFFNPNSKPNHNPSASRIVAQASASNASSPAAFKYESPRPRQLMKLVSGMASLRSAHQTPQTPTAPGVGSSGGLINPDGSLSVIRNDDDANNSGLLDLSPALGRFNKQRSKTAMLGTPISLRYASPHQAPSLAIRAEKAHHSNGIHSAAVESPLGEPVTSLRALARQNKAVLASQIAQLPHIPSETGYDAEEDRSIRITHKHASLQDIANVDRNKQGIQIEVAPQMQDEYEAGNENHVETNDEFQGREETEAELDSTNTLNRLRRWRQDAMQQHLYETAIFWSIKLLALETTATAYNDAYHLAQCYFYTHQYARAEHLLTTPLRTGASRYVSLTMQETQDHVQIKQTGAEGMLASENAEDDDVLTEALAASRKNSQLPPSLLARSSTKSSLASNSTVGKRKQRGFNVSATGTASSEAESAGSDPDGFTEAYASGHESAQSDRDQDASVVIQNPKRSKPGHTNLDSASQKQGVSRVDSKDYLDDDLCQIRDKQVPLPDGPSLVNHSLACRYLAAQCQVRLAKYHEALDLLGDNAHWSDVAGTKKPSIDGGIKLGSSVAFLRGQIYLRLEDLPRARESFMTALALDVKNFEAFSALIDGDMLGVEQQWSFIQSLEYLAQAGDDDGAAEDFEFIRLVYTTRLSKQGKTYAFNTAVARRRLATEFGLGNEPDVLLGLAEELFSRLRFADAFAVTSRILQLSADHPGALPIHIACTYHLKNLRPALFMLAHRLTELQPESPVSWYAVGTWYATTKRWAEARRYFSKASLLNPRFAPSWIAFGHTFAMEGESDQAIIAYSTAARLFPQSHLPKLFMGMEHLHQGNLSLAKLSLEGSAQLWPDDPLTANERGVAAYQSSDIGSAIQFFDTAIKLAEKTQQPASSWKDTYLNLGLAYLRAEADEQAKQALLKVTELDVHCYQAYLALGMLAHKRGDLDDAIGWYHEALSINPRDQYGTDLLDFALDEKVGRGINGFSQSLQVNNAKRETRQKKDQQSKDKGKARETGANLSCDPIVQQQESSCLNTSDIDLSYPHNPHGPTYLPPTHLTTAFLVPAATPLTTGPGIGAIDETSGEASLSIVQDSTSVMDSDIFAPSVPTARSVPSVPKRSVTVPSQSQDQRRPLTPSPVQHRPHISPVVDGHPSHRRVTGSEAAINSNNETSFDQSVSMDLNASIEQSASWAQRPDHSDLDTQHSHEQQLLQEEGQETDADESAMDVSCS